MTFALYLPLFIVRSFLTKNITLGDGKREKKLSVLVIYYVSKAIYILTAHEFKTIRTISQWLAKNNPLDQDSSCLLKKKEKKNLRKILFF